MDVLTRLTDHILIHRCDERRRYRNCGCKTKKGNPCEAADRLATGAEAMACGKPTPVTWDELTKFVEKKRCRNLDCNHPRCIKADDILAGMQGQKAA